MTSLCAAVGRLVIGLQTTTTDRFVVLGDDANTCLASLLSAE